MSLSGGIGMKRAKNKAQTSSKPLLMYVQSIQKISMEVPFRSGVENYIFFAG